MAAAWAGTRASRPHAGPLFLPGAGSGPRSYTHSKHSHGSRDVFDLLLAEIVEDDVELVAHLLVRCGTGADSTRLSQRFEPGCNVHAVTEDVAILNDDVTDIDAHAKLDAALRRYCGVVGDHLPLHLDRTAHRVDDAGELGKQAVAGGLNDATAMLVNFGIAEFTTNRTQCRERALFVFAHQTRIAGDIDRQNGRQSSFDPPRCSRIHVRNLTAAVRRR